jgi:hypothetical protein
MTFANRWSAFAARLGTSPRQLAILLASALIAIGIFGGKLVLAPKSAAAAVAQPAPATTKLPEPAAIVIPEIFMQAIPHWNLAAIPARSPFTSPADLKPVVDASTSVASTPVAIQSTFVLQATLDRTFAIVNGKTLRVGQKWGDAKSGNTFQLIEVGERTARFSVGNQVIELTLDHQ